MKSIFIVFILTNLLCQHGFGYIEKRTFRERTKMHCSELRIVFFLFGFVYVFVYIRCALQASEGRQKMSYNQICENRYWTIE